MKTVKSFIYILLLFVMVVGCTNQAAVQQATSDAKSTADAIAAQQGLETRVAQATNDQSTSVAADATQSARSTEEAMAAETATAQAQATSTALAQAQSTEEAMATGTAAAIANATAKAEASQTAAAKKILDATATAQPMADLVSKLNTDGYLQGTNGTFFQIQNFDESWAQRFWYMFFPSGGYNPTDFVLSADTFVETADKYSEYSGCGFVFHDRSTQEVTDHYIIWLDTQGIVRLGRMLNSNLAVLQQNKTDIPEATTQTAKITLVVENNYITYFVNGTKYIHWQDATFPDGNLFLTLVSGTNKDYGTHCKMTNISLWVIR